MSNWIKEYIKETKNYSIPQKQTHVFRISVSHYILTALVSIALCIILIYYVKESLNIDLTNVRDFILTVSFFIALFSFFMFCLIQWLFIYPKTQIVIEKGILTYNKGFLLKVQIPLKDITDLKIKRRLGKSGYHDYFYYFSTPTKKKVKIWINIFENNKELSALLIRKTTNPYKCL